MRKLKGRKAKTSACGWGPAAKSRYSSRSDDEIGFNIHPVFSARLYALYEMNHRFLEMNASLKNGVFGFYRGNKEGKEEVSAKKNVKSKRSTSDRASSYWDAGALARLKKRVP